MARKLRCDYKGGWYHVMARGFQRHEIFTDDKERWHFLELLKEMVERYGVVLHAYVVLNNHYHLLIETPNANASRALQWLNVCYSTWFNRRHSRSGAVFQARYKSVPVENAGGWGLACSVYIHINPVRIRALGLDRASRAKAKLGGEPDMAAQIAEALKRLPGYRWSSYPAYAGLAKTPTWLTCDTLLSRTMSDDPHAAYRKHLAERLGAADDGGFSTPRMLVAGGEAFKERLRRMQLKQQPKNAGNIGEWKRLLPFSKVVACMEKFKGEKWAEFSKRHGDWGRDMALHNGRMQCGLTLVELGEFAGMRPTTVSQSVVRFTQKLTKQPALREKQDAFCKLLETLENDKTSTP